MISCDKIELEAVLPEYIESLKNSDCNEGLLHIKSFAIEHSAYLLEKVHKLSFSPLWHEGLLQRYEIFDFGDVDFFFPAMDRLVEDIRSSIDDNRNLNIERYAFKYVANQFLPEHVDKERHKITAIAYYGDFTGGDFWFISNGKKHNFEIKGGDILISINEWPQNINRNPLHGVDRIIKGIRYCTVSSWVSHSTPV